MASVWLCSSQTELSNRFHCWKRYTTAKMSYLNAFPFQNMRHFVQIPEISEMASRHFGSDIYVILFRFWLVFEVHSHCLIFIFFFWESVFLFFMFCSIFISVESFFSSHMSFDLYIPPLALKPSLFPPPQQTCHSTTSQPIWEWHWVIGKIAKNPLPSSDLTDWFQCCV